MAKSLCVRSLSKAYRDIEALKDIQLTIQKGEFISLLGPSGCGKSTLLRIIAGLDEPSSGSVLIDQVDITSTSPAARRIGMVFQSYALFPNMNVIQNVEFALKPQKLSRSTTREKALRMLRTVGLEELAERMPQQLSGGQQQRVALARALVIEPDFLLLDEPLSALDANVRQQLQQEIRRIHDHFGMTTIMVTHDQEEALTMADRIAVMHHGEIIQFDTPQTIYREPEVDFVADFIGISNRVLTSQGMFLVRPEDFMLTTVESGIDTEVEVVHFKGSTYRMTVKVVDATSPALNDHWVVDLPASIVEERSIGVGKRITLAVPGNEHKLVMG